MPVRDFTQGVKNLKNEDSKVGGEVYTMGRAISDVLLAEGERGEFRIQDGLERAQAGALALKLHEANPKENFTVAELALIRKRVMLLAPPLTAHRILPMLDAK